jgi:hypothetical protein
MRYTVPSADLPLPELPPAPSDAPSVVALSLPKAGSTLLYSILQVLAPRAGLAYVSLEDHFFQIGARPHLRPHAASGLFRPAGYCYGGFRGLPVYDVPILPTARTVALVRDPRDMLVSLYYSVAHSHRIPSAAPAEGDGGPHYMERARQQALSRTIDEFALSRLDSYSQQFASLFAFGLLSRPNVATYRYEDVIFRKRDWVAELCDWYGWRIPQAERDAAADRFDIWPGTADPAAHVRQVTPGNHRAELAPATIRRVEGMLGNWMRLLGYL